MLHHQCLRLLEVEQVLGQAVHLFSEDSQLKLHKDFNPRLEAVFLVQNQQQLVVDYLDKHLMFSQQVVDYSVKSQQQGEVSLDLDKQALEDSLARHLRHQQVAVDFLEVKLKHKLQEVDYLEQQSQPLEVCSVEVPNQQLQEEDFLGKTQLLLQLEDFLEAHQLNPKHQEEVYLVVLSQLEDYLEVQLSQRVEVSLVALNLLLEVYSEVHQQLHLVKSHRVDFLETQDNQPEVSLEVLLNQ